MNPSMNWWEYNNTIVSTRQWIDENWWNIEVPKKKCGFLYLNISGEAQSVRKVMVDGF